MKLLSLEGFNLTIGHDVKINNGSLSVFPGDVVLLTGPNGCGKSTVLKILMGATFEYKDLDYSSTNAVYKDSLNILHSESDNETFRRNVCYVSQEDEFESESVFDCFINSVDYSIRNEKEKYVFEFIKQFSIYDCFGISTATSELKRKGRMIAKSIGILESQMTAEDFKTIQLLTMNTKHMSGGQRKLTNIFSNLIRYEFCELIILDEPLNNLDYNNVRAFSNVLTRIFKIKPSLSMLIVTHCRSLPVVNRVIAINPERKQFVEEPSYTCNSCFGKINDEGIYC